MRSYSVTTKKKNELIDITESVKKFAGEENVKEGALLVYVPHTTAGVTINEGADPAVAEDVGMQLSKIAPADASYGHAEGNSDGHVKTTLAGSSVLLPVEGGKPALGTWQSVFFCEFDGPRQRKYYISSLK